MRDRGTATGPCGEEVTLASMLIENGIAQIPVGGAIAPNLENYQKFAGAVDTNDILADIEEAESNPEVKCVLFDIDSPGGSHRGTPELAARIAAIKKPKFSFSAGCIASAAYFAASSTDAIFITPSAEAGCIGVVMAFVDQTKAYEKEGLKVELIKSGKYKGMGFPGTSLTKDHLKLLQDQCNTINEEFQAHVMAHRNGVNAEAMQGQTFIGKAAVEAGLADGLVKDKSEVLAMLAQLTFPNQ
jgi:signal peptide peptidase SppA